jgi:hypothetical protein
MLAALYASYIGESCKFLQSNENTIPHGQEILETASHFHP